MSRRTRRTRMTASEGQRGLVFFLLYLFFFPHINAWLQRLTMSDSEVLIAETNVIYYLFLFVICLFLFWGFLQGDFRDLLDWLPENLFCILVGLAAAIVLRTLLDHLPLPIQDPIPLQYAGQFKAVRWPTLALILLLIPVVEETLFRGLVFGQLRGYSRPLALAVAIPLYAVCCTWRYALELSDPKYLLLSLLYLPLSAAVTWCYDRAGSIWACVALHAGFNGFLLLTAL